MMMVETICKLLIYNPPVEAKSAEDEEEGESAGTLHQILEFFETCSGLITALAR